MKKESKKSNKTDGNEEVIVVTIDGKEYLSFPTGRIKQTIGKLVKRVQTVNYCNDNPTVAVDEAITRFEKLDASRRRNYGIRSKDSLESFVRILDDVCGKKNFPPLGKHDLQCHFTVKDFITGTIDVLTVCGNLHSRSGEAYGDDDVIRADEGYETFQR